MVPKTEVRAIAKNQMGVGFAFGGFDAGLTKVAAKISGAFGTVVGSVSGMKDRVTKSFSAVATAAVNLKNALPENLTTSLEGQFVSMSKAAHAQAFQLGYSAKAMDGFSQQASSLGYSLNTSAEAAGKVIFAWDRGADVLKAIGVDSKETALKLQEVSGLDMGQFVLQLQSAKKSLGLTDDQLKRLTNSTVAWGQQSGDVNKALAGMQDQFSHLKDRAHAFGRTLSGEELTDWAEKTNQAKQLMMALGSSTDDAEEGAKGLADTLLKQGKNMGQMFAGTSNDLTEFQTSFAVAGVDIKKQFTLMKGGPVGFIQGMADMVEESRKAGKLTDQSMNFVKRQLEQGLGDPKLADQIFNVFQKGGGAVADLIKKLPKASEDVGTLAKAAYKTGLTFSDLMQRQKDQFMMSLRATALVTETVEVNGKKIQKQIPIQQQYLNQAKKGFADMQTRLTELSKDKGPLGTVARKLRDIQIIGAAGLLPDSVRGYFPVLETLGKEFGPVLAGLGQMMPLLAALASPVVIVAAAIGGLVFWFMSARKEGDSFSQTIGRMKGQAMDFLGGLESFIVGKFPEYTETIHTVFKGIKFGIGIVMDAVALAGTGLKLIFDFIESALKGQTHFWADFGETVHDIWHFGIIEPIKLWFVNLWLDIKKGASDAFSGVTDLIVGQVAAWGKILNDDIEMLTAPFRAIDGWVDKLFRHSIDTDMKESFTAATQYADKFSKNMSSSLTAASVPVAALTGNVSVNPTGSVSSKFPPPMRPAPSVSSSDRDASLVAAVNSPQWYARYEQVFMARMASLEAAVSGRTPSPQGGRTSVGANPGASAPGRRGLPSDLGTSKYFAVDKSGMPTKVGE